MKLRNFIAKNLVIVASSVIGVIGGVEAANQNPNYPMQPQRNQQQFNGQNRKPQQQFQQQEQPSQEDRAFAAQVSRINRLAKEGNVDQAIQEVEHAISLSPNNPRLFKLRAHLYIAQKQYAQAIQDLSYLITQNPEDAELYLDRGTALYKSGNYKDAARNAKRAMQLDLNSVEAKELLMQTNHKIHKK